MRHTHFSPLAFLAALGAGGISVAPFAMMQYAMTPKGQGLVTRSFTHSQEFSFSLPIIHTLEAVMILFGILHLLLMAYFGKRLTQWWRSPERKEIMKNPLQNTVILAPLLALAMTFNVFIGTVRYFIPALHENLQSFMPYALAAWLGLFALTGLFVFKLLKTVFTQEFDPRKVHFGWMLYPFTMAMVTVVGTGIAAMAKNPNVAHLAAFFSIMGLAAASFLFLVKLFSIFMSHYHRQGLPEKQFIPGFLAAVPIMSLFGIAAFRLAHYFEKQHHLEIAWVGKLAIVGTYAFQIWFLFFALFLIRTYVTRDFFQKEYYVNQWATVCPFVGVAVLGAFAFAAFLAAPLIAWASLASLVIAIGVYVLLLSRMLRCHGLIPGAMHCS